MFTFEKMGWENFWCVRFPNGLTAAQSAVIRRYGFMGARPRKGYFAKVIDIERLQSELEEAS